MERTAAEEKRIMTDTFQSHMCVREMALPLTDKEKKLSKLVAKTYEGLATEEERVKVSRGGMCEGLDAATGLATADTPLRLAPHRVRRAS